MMKSTSACFITIRLDSGVSNPYVEITDTEGYGTVSRPFQTLPEAVSCYELAVEQLKIFRDSLVSGLGWDIDEPYTYGYGDEITT